MRYRFDGFIPEKRKVFIKTLAETGCWADAARAAHISRETARRWREKDAGFAKECESAVHMASSHIETLAWERAVIGIEEPVWHYGKLVGTRIRRSDSIFRLLLMASNRKKYGGIAAAGRKQLAKAERKRIEQEVRSEAGGGPPSEKQRFKALRRGVRGWLEAQEWKRVGESGND